MTATKNMICTTLSVNALTLMSLYLMSHYFYVI